MAGGWAPDSAVQDQIDDTIKDAVMSARAHLSTGRSETHCLECGDAIPEARRIAVPGVRKCVVCQSSQDSRRTVGGINRRGSKDSQLR